MKDDAEKVAYKKAIVSFIDILGFRGLVTHSRNDPSMVLGVIKKFREFHGDYNHDEIIKGVNLSSDEKKLAANNKAYLFSDCVVRVQDCPHEGREAVFLLEVTQLMAAQRALMGEGIFIRGGITYGDIFYNQDTIFGPAMIEAYDLESEKAIFPRLIVGQNFKEAFQKDFDSLAKAGFFRKDNEGLYFLNCFLLTKEKDEIEEIRDSIERNIIDIRNIRKREHVLEKYRWIVKEFNEAFSKEGFHIDIEKLLAE